MAVRLLGSVRVRQGRGRAPREEVQELRGTLLQPRGDGAALGGTSPEQSLEGSPRESPGFLSSDPKPASRPSGGREQPQGG